MVVAFVHGVGADPCGLAQTRQGIVRDYLFVGVVLLRRFGGRVSGLDFVTGTAFLGTPTFVSLFVARLIRR
jgi:hypothetical protein